MEAVFLDIPETTQARPAGERIHLAFRYGDGCIPDGTATLIIQRDDYRGETLQKFSIPRCDDLAMARAVHAFNAVIDRHYFEADREHREAARARWAGFFTQGQALFSHGRSA